MKFDANAKLPYHPGYNVHNSHELPLNSGHNNIVPTNHHSPLKGTHLMQTNQAEYISDDDGMYHYKHDMKLYQGQAIDSLSCLQKTQNHPQNELDNPIMFTQLDQHDLKQSKVVQKPHEWAVNSTVPSGRSLSSRDIWNDNKLEEKNIDIVRRHDNSHNCLQNRINENSALKTAQVRQ